MTDEAKLKTLEAWSELPVEQLSGGSYHFTIKDEPGHSEKKWCLSFAHAADYAVGMGTGRRLEREDNPVLPDGIVTLSSERLDDLLKSEKELDALEAGGVDNWEWYSDSLRDGGCFDEEDE